MYFIKPKEYPYYHPGLGIWIKSKDHYKTYMRNNKLEEVGNEVPGMGSKHLKEVHREQYSRR